MTFFKAVTVDSGSFGDIEVGQVLASGESVTAVLNALEAEYGRDGRRLPECRIEVDNGERVLGVVVPQRGRIDMFGFGVAR